MPTTEIAIVLLAAGKGTRMKSPLPKVLHPIAGRTMVRHVLESVKELKPAKVIGVVGKDMAEVEVEIKAVIPKAECVIQAQQLGTGHAVRQALPKLKGFKGTVLVLYADTPMVAAATMKALAGKITGTTAIAVLGFEPANPAEYGRLVTKGPALKEIVEYKDATKAERKIGLCNSGVMAISGAKLAGLLEGLSNRNAKQEYYLTDLVKIARKKNYGCTYIKADASEVLGVNSQAERAVAEALMQNKLREAHMANGVLLVAPETVFFNADTKIAGGVVIHPHVVFGPGVKVETGVEIKSFSHIEGAHIRRDATVGPYVRLRPGSDIGEESKIGNFVEVKAAKLHKGVKASHLTYIGDAEIGEDTNLGAGTVTCNYDGINKHTTTIGKNVFIGSNTSLVAPITVGNGAIVGAGSTIIKDVEADARAINHMPQHNEPGRAKMLRGNKKRK